MATTCERCGHQNTDGAKFCLQCGAMLEQAPAAGDDPLVGKILLGRYRISHVLGEGGMGKVYLAEQKMGTATRKVAIKTLHPELSGDPQLVARFYRESETVIELSHPNTIQFYDFGDLEDNTLFIVMEFIEGASLAHVLQHGALDPARVDKLLIQICGSLHEAHQIGVVHRDLKPENVLLTDRGGQTDFVKVLDFGIAKRSEAEDESQAKLTKQGMVLGTPPYMSPEQFSGQALDARSDIYSLAIMSYEMLSGKLPFEAKTPWEWATKHLTAQPTPLEAHPAGQMVPEHKKQAIYRALAKNRDERQATVLDFLREFTGHQDAQAAWTMATSAGGMATPSPAGPPRQPIGTPSPMPRTVATPAPGTMQRFGQPTPTPAPMPTPTPAPVPSSHGFQQQSSEYQVPTQGGGAGKIIAILVIVLFIVGGGAAGGLYWWSTRDEPEPTPPIATPTPTPTPMPIPTPTPTPTPTSPPNNNLGAPMVPSTPDTPTNDTPTNDTPTNDTPTNDTPTNDTPTNDTPPNNNNDPGPSAAERAEGERALAQARSALSANNYEAAATALAQARRALGPRHPQVRATAGELGREGSRQIGNLMLAGNCAGAQGLYRRLRSAGASGPSRQHFQNDWCPAP